MFTIKANKATCSSCGKPFEAHSSVENVKPKEGDISICHACGQVCLLDAELLPRKITKQELTELMMTDIETYLQVMNISARIKYSLWQKVTKN